MPATELTVSTITTSGLTPPTYADANAAGNYFINNGKTFLIVKNASASPIKVTIDSPAYCDQGFQHDVEVTVAAGAEKWIGPFPTVRFNDSSGDVQITYDAVTNVTVAVVSI